MHRNFDFIKQVYTGNTIYRALFHLEVKKACAHISGTALDLAGGGDASYYPYLPKNLAIVKTNINSGANSGNNLIVDFNESFPFENKSFDFILFFNALYIAEDRIKTFLEIKRVLKDDGTLFLSSPFIANEMPEPHDYCRLTHEGLEKELKKAGFSGVKIKRFGERFTSATYLLSPFWLTWVIKLPVYYIALLLDKCIPKRIKKEHPSPLGYFCIIEK